MKTASAVSLALFLGSMTLLAQNSGRKATPSAVAHAAPVGLGCPIEMRARRQPGEGTTALVDSGRKGPAQSLHLILNNPRNAEIVEVRMTAHGFNAKGRVSLAQTAAAESSDIKKTVDLKIKIAGNSAATADLVLPAFTSVRSVDLDSVRYADGATWRSSAGHTCQVLPDADMLISKR